MMMDRELVFAEAMAPGNVGTNGSTNYLNRGVDSDWGKGETLWLFILVGTTFVGATATINFRLVTDDEVTFTAPTVVWETGALAVGTFAAGAIWKIRVPSGFKQFTRVEAVVAAANVTAGAYTAALVRNVPDDKIYPRANYNVA